VHKQTYLFLAISWTLIITYLSLVELGDLGNNIKIPYKDKIVHFVFYFLFYFLWISYLKNNNQTRKTQVILLLVAVSYGILMEVLQAVIGNNRSCDFFDAVANSFGAILGMIFSSVFLLNKKHI
jgi:VanZ family protein